MDSEERHELQDNDLSSWLQYGLWTFLKQNGSYLLLVLALGFLGYQLWNLYEQKQENKRNAAWFDLRTAETADNPAAKLLDIASSNDYAPVQAEAYLKLGSYYGTQLVLEPAELLNKKLSRTDALTKAAGYYKEAIDAMPDDKLIAAKGHLGIASADEDLGEWDKAKAEYEILTDKAGKFAGTPYAALAASRLSGLDDRRNSPRLASMIPPPAPVNPVPQLPSSLQLPGQFPGAFTPTLPGLQVPTTQENQSVPFVLPNFPNVMPPAIPSTLPALPGLPTLPEGPTTAPK